MEQPDPFRASPDLRGAKFARGALLLAVVAMLPSSFLGCRRQNSATEATEPPVTIRIFIDAMKTPNIQYAAGPWRTYDFRSNLNGYKAQLSQSGQKPSVSLAGTLTWKDKDEGRATISFHLENTEPVIVELVGMHPDKKDAPEAKTVLRQTFAPGSHDFSRDYWVIFTYKPTHN